MLSADRSAQRRMARSPALYRQVATTTILCPCPAGFFAELRLSFSDPKWSFCVRLAVLKGALVT